MRSIGYLILIGLLASCTATQTQLLSQLSPSVNDSLFQLESNVIIKASNAKASTLNAGTNWFEVGSIDQGVVYRTRDQIVIVNSFNVHEGYIVVNGSMVVGYYLPVEKTFVESEPTTISLIKLEPQNEI